MRVKEESEKVNLKLNIKKTKIMISCPITSWQTEWEKVEAVTDFIFLVSKISADGDCSHEIKRCLVLGRKAIERMLLNHSKTPGFLASGGEEFNPGPETRLDHSELLCDNVLLKRKRDRESFWHRHRKRVERVARVDPLVSLSTGIIYSQISYYSKSKECLEVVKTSPDLLP